MSRTTLGAVVMRRRAGTTLLGLIVFAALASCDPDPNSPTTGSLTIVVDAQPNNSQDFHFAAVGAGLTNFNLDDDPNDATLLNSQTFSDLAPGNVSITQTAVAGWNLSTLSCSPAGTISTDIVTGAAAITLAAGDAVTCTYTNVAFASLTISKDALPDDAQDFHFVAVGTGLAGFDLDDDPSDNTLNSSKTFPNLLPGSFSVTETAVALWNLADISCSPTGATTSTTTGTTAVTLAAGDTVSCAYSNAKITSSTGSVTLVERTQPGDGQDFFLVSDQAGINQSILDDDSDATRSNHRILAPLPPLTYVWTQTAQAGYTLASITCTPSAHATVDLPNRKVTIVLAAGDNMICTFTNVHN